VAERDVRHSRYAAIFAGGTMLSRVLGLARDVVTLALIPAAAFDAFVIAFRLPNMLREIIGEGATNAAFVPVMSERLEKGKKRDFNRLVSSAFGVMIMLLAGLTAAGILLIPAIMSALDYVDQFTGKEPVAPERIAYLVELSQWAFPYLFFIGLAVFCSAPLFTLGHYSTPSWTPALLNVSLIATCVVARDWFSDPAYALIAGVWIGGIAQLAAQYVALGRETDIWRPRLGFEPGVGRIFLLLVPVIIGQGAGQVNRLVESLFAYGLSAGTVRALFLATRLVQLPLSIFGSATAVAILPTLARSGSRDETADMREVLIAGLRQSAFLIVPSMFGLMVLGQPIVQLFERGEFGAEGTAMAATAIVISAAGLLSFAWVKVLATGFYAAQNTRTPVIIASSCMLFNVLLMLVLVGPLGYRGLPLATTVSYTINAVLLYVFLSQAIGPLYSPAFISALVRIGCATMIMCAAAYVTHEILVAALGNATIWPRLVNTTGAIASAVVAYGVAGYMLKIEDLASFLHAFRRRVTR
jgi:putative peptidoglycan lipid II flippase